MLHFLEAAANAAQPLNIGRQFALAGASILMNASQTSGRQVGSGFVPLGVREVVERLNHFALLARRAGRAGLAVVDPINLFTSESLQQQLWPLWRTPLEEPERERPQNEDIFTAPASNRRDESESTAERAKVFTPLP